MDQRIKCLLPEPEDPSSSLSTHGKACGSNSTHQQLQCREVETGNLQGSWASLAEISALGSVRRFCLKK